MLPLWNFFLKKSSFSFLLIFALVAFGLFSIAKIPKESAPEVIIPYAIVTTIFPGAAASDVEELVTNKIEEALINSLEGMKEMTSTSAESISSVVVEFESGVDIEKSVQDVKDEVDKIKPELPTEAEDPVVSDVDFSNQPIMLISISSDLPLTEFIKLADDISDELKTVMGVSKVEKSGIRDREVQVIVNKEALQKFGVRLIDVVVAIRSTNTSLPVGTIELDGVEYTVKFKGDIDSPEQIGDIAILNENGKPVYVRDIAFVSDGVGEAFTFSRISINGEPSRQAVSINIFKRSGSDITETSAGVREKLEELQGGILSGEEVLIAYDMGEYVKDDLYKLTFTGFQTVALVIIVLFIAIGWRESLVAGLAIPLSFLFAFIGLNVSGNTINFISLFSLILAVGILVDSAIVITEGIHTNMHGGVKRREAAYKTLKEFHWPLTSGTMTTIAAFFPLFFISGITGEFIKSIPFTIISVLTASLFVALGSIPLIASRIIKKGENVLERKQEQNIERLRSWYRKKLDGFLGNRKKENRFLLGITGLFILAIIFPVTGIVKVTFFPQEDVDFLFLEIEKPEGTIIEETDLVTRGVEEILYKEKDIKSFVTTVGAGSAFAGDGFGSSGNTKIANMTLILNEDRKRSSNEILEDLRIKFANIKTAEIRISQAASGPPVGAPVLIKFLGEDLGDLSLAVVEGERILRGIEGTREINTSTKDDGLEFVLEIDKAKASEVGLDSNTVAQTLRTAVYGTTATTIQYENEDIDVVVRLNLNPDYRDPYDTNRVSVDEIEYLEIETPKGPILLGSILSSRLESANSVINHEGRDRIATLSSDISEGAITRDIIAEFKAKIKEVGLPEGVRIEVGGENEEVDQSFMELFVALIAGAVLIVSILVIQFNSFRVAGFVISIVPLSLIGIFAGLAVTGKTLSFPSMMGYIALSGIVVNNSIILIDVINKIRRENPERPLKEIVIEGAARRIRPILLTTITTIIGITPLTYAAEIWSPLAFAIIFGLSFSTIVTLLLVPILYNRWPSQKY